MTIPRSVALALVSAALLGEATEATTQPPRHALDFKLAMASKVLCSAVFVSGRDPTEAIWNSAHLAELPLDSTVLRVDRRGERTSFRYRFDRARLLRFIAPRIFPDVEKFESVPLDVVVDRRTRIVTSAVGAHRGKARFWGDQGCIAMEPDRDSIYFAPKRVVSGRPAAASQPWPQGDALEADPRPGTIDRAVIDATLDLAFDPAAYTAGMVIVHRGRIVGERYQRGVHRDMQLESWSMGKSVTATLIGLLIAEGRFQLDDPAPVPAWHVRPDDPRRQIRIADLLRMSSGLRFTNDEPPHTWTGVESDHMSVYSGLKDVFYLATNQPAEFPPNTVGRYRNSDPLTLGFLVRQAVEATGRDYLSWPQTALFDRIGVRRQVLETDMYGNFALTGYDYGTPRGWARLGLLYLQDGVWEGQRLLPPGFVDFVRAPAPAWGQPMYGGQFWVNGDCTPKPGTRPCRHPDDAPSRPEFAMRRWNLPVDAYFMAGAAGQFVFVVPSAELVVVRMGHWRGMAQSERALNRALGRLMEGLPR